MGEIISNQINQKVDQESSVQESTMVRKTSPEFCMKSSRVTAVVSELKFQ